MPVYLRTQRPFEIKASRTFENSEAVYQVAWRNIPQGLLRQNTNYRKLTGQNKCIDYLVLLRDSVKARESLSVYNKRCNVSIMTVGYVRATTVTVKSNKYYIF